MRWTALFLAFMLAIPATASAQEDTKPREFELPFGQTILCVEDKKVGFNWRKGDWTNMTFKPQKFIVVKWTIFWGTVTTPDFHS